MCCSCECTACLDRKILLGSFLLSCQIMEGPDYLDARLGKVDPQGVRDLARMAVYRSSTGRGPSSRLKERLGLRAFKSCRQIRFSQNLE